MSIIEDSKLKRKNKMISHNIELKREIASYLSHVFSTCENKHLNKIVLDRLLWTASEDNLDGKRVKYLGQYYWSKAAILKYREKNIGRKMKDFSGLRHEHVMPRKLIKEMIEKKLEKPDNKSEDSIFDILESYLHAVIITKEEDTVLNEMGRNQSMPKSFDKTDEILDRYKDTGIEVIFVKDKDLKTLEF